MHAKLLEHAIFKDPQIEGLVELLSITDASRERFKAQQRLHSTEAFGGATLGPTAEDVMQVEAEYPRAALWLKALHFSRSPSYRKSVAGENAMALIEGGADESEAQKVLDDWLQNHSFWDEES
ncbi:MAG: hypothetical protein ACLQVD_16285 [Capsulimonadaceae bacterium]